MTENTYDVAFICSRDECSGRSLIKHTEEAWEDFIKARQIKFECQLCGDAQQQLLTDEQIEEIRTKIRFDKSAE